MPEFTIILPYYEAPAQLEAQVAEWASYPPGISICVIDDGSPRRSAGSVLAGRDALHGLAIYRIAEDIPWNQPGARNLGAREATTDWLLLLDCDHLLPADSARALRDLQPVARTFYTLDRPGERPHPAILLIERSLYWEVGGYDEAYSGHYGYDDHSFRARLDACRPPCAHVHLDRARVLYMDQGGHGLPRDTRPNWGRFRADRKARWPCPTEHCRFPWHRVF